MGRGKLTIVVDLAFGSCGKGSICAHIAGDYDMAVRVGAIQAGHTIYYNDEIFKMQVIPCAWINPKCELVIGAGGMIREDILQREIDWITYAMYNGDFNGIKSRLSIDHATGIMDHSHAERELARKLHTTIGSTCEGVGEATADRVRRMLKTAGDAGYADQFATDTVKLINDALRAGKRVMLEGTQGAALCLFTGRDKDGHPYYPNCTSREVTPSAIMADCGINPGITKYADIEVIGVLRTYPIRIAGPSGDIGQELTWEEITRRCGAPEPITEKTTVTKKTRRVGEFDWDWTKYVTDYIMPDKLVLTFVDYIDYADHGKRTGDQLSPKTMEFIQRLQNTTGVPVWMAGTGPANEDFVDLMDDGVSEPEQEFEETLVGTRPKKKVNPEFAPVYQSRINQTS